MHKKITRIITNFNQGVEDELMKTQEKMEAQARAADSYFEGLSKKAQYFKANLQGSLEVLSDDVKVRVSQKEGKYDTDKNRQGLTTSVMGAIGGMGDFQRLLNTLRDTFLQTNAEMAAHHENTLALMTNGAVLSLERIREAGEINELTAARTNELLVSWPMRGKCQSLNPIRVCLLQILVLSRNNM